MIGVRDCIAVGRKLLLMMLVKMLMAPYVVQIIFTIAALVRSITHPNAVTRERRFFYCALEYDPL